MARYVREVQINQPEDFVNFMVNDFLTKHGFKYVEFKGEMIYRAGGGLIEIPKFFIWNYQNGVIHVEAWTRNVWLPGVYGRENALKGYMGCVPKGAYKSDVEQLLSLLMQPVPQQNGQFQGQQEGQEGASQPVQQSGPIMVQGVDTSRYANMSLAFGIIGMVVSCIWYLGLIFGICAIVYGNKGKASSKQGRATAGLVCGIIAVVLAIVMFVLGLVGVFEDLL